MAKKKNGGEQKYEKILAPSEQEVNRDVLPQNVIKMGEQVLHEKNIYIMQSVYKEIHEFTKDKLTVESGGMLMGYTIQANGKTNIIIDGFIEGKHSEGTPTTLKFTHETWDYVHKEADEHFPNDKIIGWIHTHPNFGIFLSNYDKFIHQNFFNDENQIAYVIDPIQHIEGFFFWINGQIEKCPGFYIYDEVGIEIELPEQVTAPTTAEQVKNTSSIGKADQKGLYIAFGVLSLLSIIGFIALSARISELHESVNALNEQLLTQNQTIAANVQSVGQNVSSLKTDLGKHTIVFLSDDGTLLAKQEYATGDIIVPPTDIPQKSDDEMYTYTFSGWDADFGYAFGDVVYQAVYTSKLREYTITFEDENGNEISSDTYHYGDEIEAPEYAPDEMPDDGKEYEVTWDKEIGTVSEDTTYKAVIKEVTSDSSSETEDAADNTEITEETASVEVSDNE
ncbi:MAG: hypothetical protein IJ825_10575 [Oscillospiraceae bacterium]|nr:hypothetical protein [Oscillospiraceae bacterium]